jgi:hypothetical protein
VGYPVRLARCVVEDHWPVRRAAERFQVSLTTAARWAARYREHGAAGMADRALAPDGAVLVVEPNAADNYAANLANPRDAAIITGRDAKPSAKPPVAVKNSALVFAGIG